MSTGDSQYRDKRSEVGDRSVGWDSSPDSAAKECHFTSELWSEFTPSFPALVSRSHQLVAAVWKVGESFGDFQIQRLLGEGAFGKVFLARQISLDRQVALKVTANLRREILE